jgi:translocation and assembly module TamB
MRAALILALTAAAITPAFAQDDDRDFLTAFLEDNLSDAGREVTITGFSGALSSQATIQQLTIADDSGIWLTINGVTLDWSRSALLAGEVTVSQLSADEILLDRLPTLPESDLPAPEATGFSLPDLPVSIAIDRLSAGRIVLDPAILGQPVEGSLSAALSLAAGEGTATLDLLRTGQGPKGEIILDASYSNATRQLLLDLSATEDAGGLVVSLLGVPGAPAAAFQLTGSGPVEDHSARIRLATDGQDRLAGTVTLQQDDQGAYRLLADVAGNLAPILVPDYVDFFGDRVALALDARRSATGRILLDRVDLSARTLRLTGRAVLASDGLPEIIDLAGTLADPDGAPVLLPFGDSPTRLDRAAFSLAADTRDGSGWRADVTVTGLNRADLTADRFTLSGSGRIGRTPAGNTFGGTLTLAGTGLLPADPSLAAALGTDLQAGLRFHLLQGSGTFRLSDVTLQGQDYQASAAARIEGLDSGLLTTGTLTVRTTDLSRFSALAGRPLAGAGTVRLDGSAGLLSGTLDAEAQVQATGLQLGIAQLDRLLSGPAALRLSVLRDETGTTLRRLDLTAASLALAASGRLATTGTTLDGEVRIADLSDLGPPFAGSVDLTAAFSGTVADGQLALLGTGRGLRLGSAEADRLLAGTSAIEATLRLQDGAVQISQARIANPQLTLTVQGLVDGLRRVLDIDARLADLGILIPDLTGALVLDGTATQGPTGYVLDISGRGPGQIEGQVTGSLSSDLGTADLALAGTGRAALANLFISPRVLDGTARYDLALRGPLRLTSLSGRITLANGRLADPGTGLSLEGIEALAQIQAGRAQLSSTMRLSTGGLIRLDGPVSLSPPFDAQLAVSLDRLRLVDPELYEAVLSGRIGVNGALAGGASITGDLTLTQAELRVPSSGFSGAAALLDITHVNEPTPVRDTRAKAGLLGTHGAEARGGEGTARPFPLDLTVSAPAQIFVRGRGIDAELGGALRLGGTTAAILPAGAFNLIRGRLDILGKRLVLSTADLQLEGSFVPILLVAAQTESDGIVSSVFVEGPADNPEVRFASIPELPQEEVLSRLLFGRDLGSLSALQAAQLANAIAVLAGRGGEGLVNRLRKSFGLDDLDLTTSEDGGTALTAGKYLSENLYTQIEIEQGGKSRVSLNLDLREGVTVRGRVGDDGETGIGIFVERDY